MRFLIIVFVSLFNAHAFGQKYINPEGYYKLVGKVKKDRDGNITSPGGDIQVKKLTEQKIVVVIYGIRGEPSYNMGYLKDTVQYRNNSVTCRSETDNTCKISIKFTRNKAFVIHDAPDYNFSCDFGHGVFVGGTYIKKKKEILNLIDPYTGEVFKD